MPSVGFPDALTVTGELSAGAISGRAVQDGYDWGGRAPLTALATMDISATKQGPSLSGRIRMIYWVYREVRVVPPGCRTLDCTYGIPNYIGDAVRTIDFTATRLQ